MEHQHHLAQDKPRPEMGGKPLDYAFAGGVTPQRPLGRRARWVIVGLCVVGMACLGLFAFVPLNAITHDAQFRPVQIAILRAAVAAALGWLLLPGLLLPMIGACILLVRRRILLGVLLLAAAGLISLAAAAKGISYRLGPWTICDQVTASDGALYCFVDSSFLQGQQMAIARLNSTGPLYQTLDVLGTTNGDWPRSYLLVVRPVPPKPVAYGALYAASAGLLVGLRHDNHCYLVYDLSGQTFHGHGDVETLSPFLMIEPSDQLHAPDEAAIIRTIQSAGPMGAPTRDALEQAVAHPNPGVRQSAANIIRAMK